RNVAVAAAILLLQSTPSDAEIISGDRKISWAPGIPGGIPNRVTIFANVKNPPYNAAGDGIHDDTAALQTAVAACPSNQVVYAPAGIYRTLSPVRLDTGQTF